MYIKSIIVIVTTLVVIINCSHQSRLFPLTKSTSSVELKGEKYPIFNLDDVFEIRREIDLIYEGTINEEHIFWVPEKFAPQGYTNMFGLNDQDCIVENPQSIEDEKKSIIKNGFRFGVLMDSILVVKRFVPQYYKMVIPIKKDNLYILYDTTKYYICTPETLLEVQEDFCLTYIGSTEQYHLFRTFGLTSSRENVSSFIALKRSDCIVNNERNPYDEKAHIYNTHILRDAKYVEGKFIVDQRN